MKKYMTPNIFFVLVIFLASIILIFIPTGFDKDIYKDSIRTKAEILSTDNSLIKQTGIIKSGDQTVKVKILKGTYKGKEFEAVNHLKGQLEFDKIFVPGDNALVVLDINSDDQVVFVNVIDHYRINVELILLIAFAAVLIGFAGWVGVKSVLSFFFTVLMIWKVLIPLFLKGFNPILVSALIVVIITFVIIFLVTNFTRKGLVAFLGSSSGIIITCILSIIFGKAFKLHGAVVPFSETLLYSGFGHLDLTKIFLSGIFLASSGAVMDVAMDIAAAIDEIVEKKPTITAKEAILSGFNVARSVLGTMTTTLLLAYSGGYTALLMVFMAQGTPVINILNLTYVSSEILHTIVGSFGLILVAPITSILGGLLLTDNYNISSQVKNIGD
jgi:uncharacterized membrane protein